MYIVAATFKIQAESLVSTVSVDKTLFSLSFTEYLTLICDNRRAEATGNSLLDAFL